MWEANLVAMSSGRERKSKGGEAGANKLQSVGGPSLSMPNVKEFQRNLTEISSQIKEKELQRRELTFGGGSMVKLNGELNKATSELSDIGQLKSTTTTEIREVEEKVRRLGPEITAKKEEASKVLVGLRYKTNERIEEALRKLRQQQLTRQYSGTEEKRLQSEIDTLEGSKDGLREYQKTKAEVEELIQEQGQLRERRNSLYRKSRELKSREGEAKDRQAVLRQNIAVVRDEKRNMQEQKDALTEVIDGLYKARQKLRDDFKKAQSTFLRNSDELESEEREKESVRRGAERQERIRRLELKREMKYEEEKITCRTLIFHLEKMAETSLATPASPSSHSVVATTSNGGPDLDPQRSHSSPAAVAPSLSNGGGFKKPGEFLPRKTEDLGGYLVPSSSRKKSKRDKKRHTPSGKTSRRLQYDPMVLSQFDFLSVAPPTGHSTIPQVLGILRDKLAFYEQKTMSYSEAGDSGISSQAFGELAADLNSQEDLVDITSPNRQPLKPLLLATTSSPPAHIHANGGPSLPPTVSTTVTTLSPASSPVVTPTLSTSGSGDGSGKDEERSLHHSISTASTTTSNTSTSTLVQPTTE